VWLIRKTIPGDLCSKVLDCVTPECLATERDRGREDTQDVVVLPVPKHTKVFSRWLGIKTIGAIIRIREHGGKLDESQGCFITSLPCMFRKTRDILRSHWSIDNSQHYILDVTLTEDSSRIRKGTGPENSSVFRRLALTILQQDAYFKGSLRGKRKVCGRDEAALERLLAGFTEV